jgi:hypothetical protein
VDQRVTELHCIMPLANIASVMTHGVLSHERAAKLPHHSVAMQPIQERRAPKPVPGGLKLHQYANLYFHARNPMMYKRQGEALNLCVLRVSPQVLKMAGVVISDQNAASDWVRFYHPNQWLLLDFDAIFAMDWRHPDQKTFWQQRAKKCAEVLVPHRVDPQFIIGAHVVNEATKIVLGERGFQLPVR